MQPDAGAAPLRAARAAGLPGRQLGSGPAGSRSARPRRYGRSARRAAAGHAGPLISIAGAAAGGPIWSTRSASGLRSRTAGHIVAGESRRRLAAALGRRTAAASPAGRIRHPDRRGGISTSVSRRRSVNQAGCAAPLARATSAAQSAAPEAARLGGQGCCGGVQIGQQLGERCVRPRPRCRARARWSGVLRRHDAGACPDQQIAQAVGVPGEVGQQVPAAPARQPRWFAGLLIGQPGRR